MKRFIPLILFILLFEGCSGLIGGLVGSDHISKDNYNFIIYDANGKYLSSGIMKIENIIKDKYFKGYYKIKDFDYSYIPSIDGIIDGMEKDNGQAEFIMKPDKINDTIEVQLKSRWNLLEGTWFYKEYKGKFIAFEKKTVF